MKCAIYARVSTQDQHCELQLNSLHRYCKSMGWEPVEYVEKASGKKGSNRPEFQRLMQDARARAIDVVIVWKMDRFGRSLQDFLHNVSSLHAAGVRFIIPGTIIDTDKRSALANLLMNILACFAEFERDLMLERVNAGLAEYRRAFAAGEVGQGKRRSKSGKDKAIGRPRKVFRRDRILELKAQGMSQRAIGRELKVPESTVRLALRTAA